MLALAPTADMRLGLQIRDAESRLARGTLDAAADVRVAGVAAPGGSCGW
jgi:hypothetical protein